MLPAAAARLGLASVVVLVSAISNTAHAACVRPNFCVTNTGAGYSFNGGPVDQTLELVRGQTYTFEVNAQFHPLLFIADVNAAWLQPAYDTDPECVSCLTNNGTGLGTITFTVPAAAADANAGYVCEIHSFMKGRVTFVDSLCSNVTCDPGDQCHDAGVCNPADGTCSAPAAKTNGTDCDDGDACTTGETCQAGVCGSAPTTVTCSPPADDCHTQGVCDPSSGVCSNPKAPDDTICDDGLACTTGDSCQAGVCVPTASNCPCATPADCPAPDQCHEAPTCNEQGQCVSAAKSDGTGCDDSDACTTGESCQAGVCGSPTSTVTCTAPDACHDAGTCDASTGQCVHPAVSNGTPCNDANACTSGETCQAGVCGAPTSSVTCTALDSCHEIGTCAPATGVCDNPAIPSCNMNMGGYPHTGCSAATPAGALIALGLLATLLAFVRRRAHALARVPSPGERDSTAR